MRDLALCLVGIPALFGVGAGALRAEGVPSASPPPTQAQAQVQAPQQWHYTLKTGNGPEQPGQKAPIKLVVVETGRRTVASRQIVDLAIEVNGRRVKLEDLSDMPSAPFGVFGVSWSLVFGKDKRGNRIDLALGEKPLDAAALSDLSGAAATWRPQDRLPARPAGGKQPKDKAYSFQSQVGSWKSSCMAYAHPSPDTGDYYEWTRCFAPGVGVTLLEFDSVWGTFRCELTKAPERPALP